MTMQPDTTITAEIMEDGRTRVIVRRGSVEASLGMFGYADALRRAAHVAAYLRGDIGRAEALADPRMREAVTQASYQLCPDPQTEKPDV